MVRNIETGRFERGPSALTAAGALVPAAEIYFEHDSRDAAMLRTLTSPVRQLADMRSAPPDRDELADASGCQDHLERQAAQLASRKERNAARHLADLSRQLVSELTRPLDSESTPR
jgi:hypothetical protein